jgi:5'-3' exonuclease
MDCNSIIYDEVYRLEAEIQSENIVKPNDFEDTVIKSVIDKIKFYIELIKPTQTVYIAFDGVAPFAKMDQQRTRRYKTLFMKTINIGDSKKSSTWNTSAITPGTEFMNKLSHMVVSAFEFNESEYGVNKILVSGSNQCGEGEHKLFEYLRDPQNNPSERNVAVYGLDADLIMLSIFHFKYCKNIYVFRETPEFLKNALPIDIDKKNSKEPHFLDIRHLAYCILSEMNCKYPDDNRIYDYVFLCFFLGNDFLPHFPAMNIRTHGIQALLDIYCLCIGNKPDCYFISKPTGEIIWKNVGIFLNEIAKREHEFLVNEYFLRDKFDKRRFNDTTQSERDDLLLNTPIIYRAEEKYINPYEDGWEKRYYKTLFQGIKNVDHVRKVCINYYEALEWVYKYYTKSCPDWRWKYNYNYPPLFTDLCKYTQFFVKESKIENKNRPYLDYIQLAYVLPRSNLDLLPLRIREYLINNYVDLYPREYKFNWCFCRYLWEAHPILPEISIEILDDWNRKFS